MKRILFTLALALGLVAALTACPSPLAYAGTLPAHPGGVLAAGSNHFSDVLALSGDGVNQMGSTVYCDATATIGLANWNTELGASASTNSKPGAGNPLERGLPASRWRLKST